MGNQMLLGGWVWILGCCPVLLLNSAIFRASDTLPGGMNNWFPSNVLCYSIKPDSKERTCMCHEIRGLREENFFSFLINTDVYTSFCY